MSIIYFVNIIPLLFSLIHLSTPGWIVYTGHLNIIEFIHEDLTLNWGIQYIDMSIGNIHFQMRPPDLINFLKEHTNDAKIHESSIPTYYILLSMYYIILLCNISFVWLSIQHYSQPHLIANGIELPRNPYPGKQYICSKYMCYGQLLKTIIHIIATIFMYLRMGHDRLCLDGEEQHQFETLTITMNDCYYSWQSPSYLTALLVDICVTIMYLGNMARSRRVRKNSEHTIQLLGV